MDDLMKSAKALAYHMRECTTHDEVDAATVQEMCDRIEALEAQLAKAVALVEDAYCEGFAEGDDGGWIEGDYSLPWKRSEAHKTLASLDHPATAPTPNPDDVVKAALEYIGAHPCLASDLTIIAAIIKTAGENP
jgi:hypothetical protein